MLPDENGTWHIDEDEVALLKTNADDSENDQGTMIVEWHLHLKTKTGPSPTRA